MVILDKAELTSVLVEQTFAETISVTYTAPESSFIVSVTCDTLIPKINVSFTEASVSIEGFYVLDTFPRSEVQHVAKASSDILEIPTTASQFVDVPPNREVISYRATPIQSKIVTYTITVSEGGEITTGLVTQLVEMDYTPGKNALQRYQNAISS